MNLNKIEVLNALQALNVPYEARGTFLSLALARVIGYGLAIPAPPEDGDVGSLFNREVAPNAEKLICEFNEQVQINIDATLDVIRKIFTFRYNVLYNAFNPATNSFLDALLRAGESNMNPAHAELMTNYGEDRDLLNILTRAVWEFRLPTQAPVAVEVSTEQAGCICPSTECHAHPGGVVSTEGVKGAVLGALITLVPGLSMVSGGVMGHKWEQLDKKVAELMADRDKWREKYEEELKRGGR